MTTCPCSSEKDYDQCCGAIIRGERRAATPLEVMRSRYTAFATAEIDYLESSHHPETRGEFSREQAHEWATKSKWLGFEVLRTEAGGPEDDTGIVEFVARYELEEQVVEHHETSEFRKADGIWYFHDGQEVPVTVRRDAPKVGRNDPCPCGSGKKSKKCCGKA